MTCPFCNPPVESVIFAHSENFLAIYNIAPILPGHSLIIPKKHLESIMELNDSGLSEMVLFTKKVTELLLAAFHAEAFNWSLQEKEYAGQSVAHLHLHIVPRYQSDFPEPGDWYPKINANFQKVLDSQNRERISDDEMGTIIYRLREMAGKRQLYGSV